MADNSSITELRERLGALSKKLLTLEWDKEHNQLNAGMEAKYNEMKEEHNKLESELKSKS